MPYYSSLPFYILSLLFLFSSILFPISSVASHSFSQKPTSGKNSEGIYKVEHQWWIRRSLVEGPISEPVVENPTMLLASERTNRKDPLDGFKRYTRGWNISDRHYWASVSFTAVPLFVTATIWFLGFGLCLLIICLCYFCCERVQNRGYSSKAFALSFVFLIIFTITAIIGSIVLYTGQARLHHSTVNTLKYVVNQAETTAEKLRNVSEYLSAAKQIGVDHVFLPSNVQTDIDQIGTEINSSASILADRTMENSDDIKYLLEIVRLALIVIAAVMLLLTFLGLAFSFFGMQFLVYTLVIIGWILVTGTCILCGIFLLLHNVAADTCIAMDQWVQNPTAHTALDDILPCVDNATAQDSLLRSKEVTSHLVEMINEVLTNVSNINFSPNFPPMYYNQSGPLVPLLCNPFYSDLTNRDCSDSEVDLNDAMQVLKNSVCEVSASGICITTGRLTPAFYEQMSAALNVCYGLYNYAPFLIELEDCTFVRHTFREIHRGSCPGLQLYSRWVYIGLAIVSGAVMLSLIFWIIYEREQRHRIFVKQFIARSEQDKDI